MRISLRAGIAQAEGDRQDIYDLLGVLIQLGVEPITLAFGEDTAAMMWAAREHRFTSIRGSVQVKRAGTLEWIDATLTMTLGKGDEVRTANTATAEILFADNTKLGLRPDSLTAILESSEDMGSHEPRLELGLPKGEFNFQTPPQEGERKFETPAGRTIPRPATEGKVQVKPDGSTGVSISKGEAQVETRTGQQLRLGPNQDLQIGAAGKAGPTTALLDAPILTAPPNEFTASYPDPPQATTLLSWNGVAGAKSYRVVVDTSTVFASPIIDR